MPMGTEDARVGSPIQMTREPVGPKRAGGKGSIGDQALMDAVLMVIGAWAVVVALAVSLRSHNA